MNFARMIHEHFCCDRGFAAATGLRWACSTFAPSTYYRGMVPFILAHIPVRDATGQAPPQMVEPVPRGPHASLATRLRNFSANRHELCGLNPLRPVNNDGIHCT